MFVAFNNDLGKKINESCSEYDHRILEDLNELSDRMHELCRDLGNIIGSNYRCDILFIDIRDLIPRKVSREFIIFLAERLIKTAVVHEYGYAAFVICEAFNRKII